MTEIKERFVEVCPNDDVCDFTRDEIIKGCSIAFRIIGYDPNDLDGAVDKAWDYFEKEIPTGQDYGLGEFAYDVWRLDHEQ